jgi:hypothetical protein
MSEEVQTAAEFISTVVNLADNSTTLSSRKCIVRGIAVNTVMSAHICDVLTGSVHKRYLPSATPAGTWFPFGDVAYPDGIVINPDDAATGEIEVVYKEM